MSRRLLVIDPAENALQAFLASVRGPLVAASERVEVTPREDVEPLLSFKLETLLFWCMVGLAIYPLLDCCHPPMGGACIVLDYEPPNQSPPRYTEEEIDAIAYRVIHPGWETPEALEGVQAPARQEGEFSAFQRERGVSDEMAEAAVKESLMLSDGSLAFSERLIRMMCETNQMRGISPEYRPSDATLRRRVGVGEWDWTGNRKDPPWPWSDDE